MSDAACGPSNPLQQFRKQTQLDRTLQQDRLSSRHLPSQGFRTADAQSIQLDSEFEAFQAGLPTSDLQHFRHSPIPHAFAAPAAGHSWANDFQRLQISQPSPSHAFQSPQNVEQAALGSTGWANDFRAQLATPFPGIQSISPSPHAFQQRSRFGLSGFHGQFSSQNLAETSQMKGKAPMEFGFDDAAFEQAFDQARQDLMQEVLPDQLAQTESVLQTTEDRDTKFTDALSKMDSAAREFTLQEDRLREQEAQEQAQRYEDDDAMAATANELLEKVAHNQSEKFKNSQFLGLMRKLRDREVKVEGDKMVETSTIGASSANNMEVPPPLKFPEATLAQIGHRPVGHSDVADDMEIPPPLKFPEAMLAQIGQRPLGHSGVPVRVDTQRPEYGIPAHEQDHDAGRIDPTDGQAVIDLLSQPGEPADREDLVE